MAHRAMVAQGLAVIGRHHHDGVLPPGLRGEPFQEQIQITIQVSDLTVVQIVDVLQVSGRQLLGPPVQRGFPEAPRIGQRAKIATVEPLQRVRPPLEVVVDLVGVQKEEEGPGGDGGQTPCRGGKLVGEHRRVLRGPVGVEPCIEAERGIEEPAPNDCQSCVSGAAKLALKRHRHRDGLDRGQRHGTCPRRG